MLSASSIVLKTDTEDRPNARESFLADNRVTAADMDGVVTADVRNGAGGPAHDQLHTGYRLTNSPMTEFAKMACLGGKTLFIGFIFREHKRKA